MLWCPWVGSPASLLMDQLGGQGGSLSYATRPPKEQGGAVEGALGWVKVRCDLVLGALFLTIRGGSAISPTQPNHTWKMACTASKISQFKVLVKNPTPRNSLFVGPFFPKSRIIDISIIIHS